MTDWNKALAHVMNELLHGAPPRGGFVLNGGDEGLLASVERLTSEEASEIPEGATASVAAHVDHLLYGLGLMNRWRNGEQPFADADWTASWQRNEVTEEDWVRRLDALRREAVAWADALPELDSRSNSSPMSELEANGVTGSVVHLAYHMGAIRQLQRASRGPSAQETVEAEGA